MIIRPPKTGNTGVIEPPEGAGLRMPTAPELEPTPRDQASESATGLGAQDRVAVASMLTAARDSASRGDIEGCFADLRRAKGYLAQAIGD